MKTIRHSLFVSLVLISQSAFAQLPVGNFSGYISSNPYNQWCQLNRAEIDIQNTGNQTFQINWRETGFAQGAGFCENDLDASFTPSGRENEWDVNFYQNFDLVFGHAVLNGNQLEITASYNSSNTNLLRFDAKILIQDNQKSLNYFRQIETWSGPSDYANGNLYAY